MKSIEVLMGFDMETDIGSWTPFYEGLRHGTPRVIEILKAHGVKATFYFVGQAARDVPESVGRCMADGHEIGTHSLFHETMGEPIFPIPGITPLLDFEVERRLELNTDWVEAIAGIRPRSFRAPRLFGSTSLCNALEKLGYVSDATYPLYHFREQLKPYHPAATDWTQTGELQLLEIPNFADLSTPSKDPFGRDRDQWPVFRTSGAQVLLSRVDSMLRWMEAQGHDSAVLAFYFHPWEFHPMPGGLIAYGEGAVLPDAFIVQNCGDFALCELDRFLDGLKKRGAVFKTAERIAESTRS